jgi:CRP-like cAMP-binding protein
LLLALPARTLASLSPWLRPVELVFGAVLANPGKAIAHVYFPLDSLISLLTVVEGRQALEVGMVGREGMLGVPLALGIGKSPVIALVQGGGRALRMTASNFRLALERHAELSRVVLRYAHELMSQVSQTAACNRFHFVEGRLARWLLMTQDRVRSARFRLTQEFLGHMLGVRRVGISEAAGALQRRALIVYNRGEIVVLDRKGLEAASCACYGLLGSYGGAGKPS